MEIKIISEKLNSLFSRREVRLEIKTQLTPSKSESKKIVADKFKVDETLIRIRGIKGKFGVSLFIITADIYNSKNEFNRIVKKTKKEIEAEKKKEENSVEAEASKIEKRDIEQSEVEEPSNVIEKKKISQNNEVIMEKKE